MITENNYHVSYIGAYVIQRYLRLMNSRTPRLVWVSTRVLEVLVSVSTRCEISINVWISDLVSISETL